MKSEWFKTVLSTNFKEKEEQAVDLPEEDPGIFHFIIAFLYEERYAPIRPVASVLGLFPSLLSPFLFTYPLRTKGDGPFLRSAPQVVLGPVVVQCC